MKFKRIIPSLKRLYWDYFSTNEEYARHIGVTIGKKCFINTRKWSTEPYLITIGDNCQITRDVYFHTHGGGHVARSVIPDFDVFGKIKVCNGVYLGAASHIMPGVTIGEGALIAAGSVVTHSVPAHTVWGGVPARQICTVEEYIENNKQYNVNTKHMSKAEKRTFLLSMPDDRFLTK